MTLLVCAALWLTSSHRHQDDHGHTCAVCVAAHSPAVATTAVPAPPALSAGRATAVVGAYEVLARRALGIAPSRAPPLS